MALVNPSNDALIRALGEAKQQGLANSPYAFAVIPKEGGRFMLILADCSEADPRYLKVLKSVKGVRKEDIVAKIAKMKKVAARSEDINLSDAPVFLNTEHSDEFHRCWVYARPGSLDLNREVFAEYNPTV